ncbi:MAG: outer membrane beta-barrel protein [Bacteroidales bacterium]
MIPLRHKIKIIISLMVVVSAISSQSSTAQNDILLSYDLAIPAGNTKEYISTSSARGGTLEIAHLLNDEISLGLRIGLQTFYEIRDKDLYTEDNISIYGKQVRYINSFPIMVAAKYKLTTNRLTIPYAGLALGTYFFEMQTDMGLYNITNDNMWNFGFQPEAGLLIGISDNLRLNLSTKYNHIFKNSSVDSQGYYSFGIGFMIYNSGRE